jgi:ArsR family transcriptional regulator, cadmium/lead-responsive transcriptional repressor
MTEIAPRQSARTSAHALQAKFFRGFTDPARLVILEALCESPRTVGELATIAGLSQPGTSNHLSCLLDCGLVEREQRGRYGMYSIADPRVASLLRMGADMLRDHAAEVAACTHMGTVEDTRL